MTLEKALMNYIHDPHNAELNFQLGYEYEKQGQTAAAFSFYLRAAEKYKDRDKQYESMIRGSYCFAKQGRRNFSVKGMLKNTICINPHRPEAYFLLSQLHQVIEEWSDSYMISSIGLEVTKDKNFQPLTTNVGYPGYTGLMYQKGIAAWWAGIPEEARSMLSDLYYNYDLSPEYKSLVEKNIEIVGISRKTSAYNKHMHERIRFNFDNSSQIENNYSRAYQDMFVLSVLNGKQKGVYVEIGDNDPIKDNNTILLEKIFNWKGITIENNENHSKKFFNDRQNPIFHLNPLEVDYDALFTSMVFNDTIDFLQITCNSSQTSYDVLKKIPFNKYRFAVVIFKHDSHKDDSVRELSRNHLKNRGYELLVNDVQCSSEDWWVHPKLVEEDTRNKMKSIKDADNCATTYMFLENNT